jgi:hypothetical protein
MHLRMLLGDCSVVEPGDEFESYVKVSHRRTSNARMHGDLPSAFDIFDFGIASANSSQSSLAGTSRSQKSSPYGGFGAQTSRMSSAAWLKADSDLS